MQKNTPFPSKYNFTYTRSFLIVSVSPALSYFGYYGGTKALPESWIFGGLILYSAALLWLATYMQQPKEHARQLLFESGLLIKLHSSN
jgi:hypothetical protein